MHEDIHICFSELFFICFRVRRDVVTITAIFKVKYLAYTFYWKYQLRYGFLSSGTTISNKTHIMVLLSQMCYCKANSVYFLVLTFFFTFDIHIRRTTVRRLNVLFYPFIRKQDFCCIKLVFMIQNWHLWYKIDFLYKRMMSKSAPLTLFNQYIIHFSFIYLVFLWNLASKL